MQRAGLMLVFVAGNALAHPAHESGWLSASLSHLLSEPDHLAVLLFPLVIVLAWVLRRKGDRRLPGRDRLQRAKAPGPSSARSPSGSADGSGNRPAD